MTNINMVPDFTGDDSTGKGTEETVQPVEATPDEGVEKEKETLAEPPAEPKVEETQPEEQKPTDSEPDKPESSVDATSFEKRLQELKEKNTLLVKQNTGLIQDLQKKREIKREESKVVQKSEDLKDVHPDDTKLIEKVLRSKGYLTKEESHKMYYDQVKKEQLSSFLEKFPEYKPENDPNDVNWNTLQNELAFYRMPDDPSLINKVLLKAHNAISGVKTQSDRTLEVKKQQLKTAGVGASGVQKSSSRQRFDPEKRVMLKQGGFTDDDIQKMESRLK